MKNLGFEQCLAGAWMLRLVMGIFPQQDVRVVAIVVVVAFAAWYRSTTLANVLGMREVTILGTCIMARSLSISQYTFADKVVNTYGGVGSGTWVPDLTSPKLDQFDADKPEGGVAVS